MKRKIDKTEYLSAFKLDFPRLSLLISELCEQFKDQKPDLSITFKIKDEELDFSSIDELKEYIPNLPSQLREITISINDSINYRNRFSLFSYGNRARVAAVSSDEIWCVVMVQICKKYSLQNKRWYSFIKPIYSYLMGFVILLIPLVLIKLFAIKTISVFISTTWFLLIILFFIIFFLFEKIFPGFILELRNEDNVIKKYSTELTLLFTILAFII